MRKLARIHRTPQASQGRSSHQAAPAECAPARAARTAVYCVLDRARRTASAIRNPAHGVQSRKVSPPPGARAKAIVPTRPPEIPSRLRVVATRTCGAVAATKARVQDRPGTTADTAGGA